MLFSAVKHRLKPTPRLSPPLASPAATAAAPVSTAAASRRCGSHAAGSHASLLLGLRSSPALAEVRRLHAALLVRGHRDGTVLAAQLVQAYARFGETGHALRVLDGMPRRNSFAWNAAIKGLVDAGRFSEALEVYWAMVDMC